MSRRTLLLASVTLASACFGGGGGAQPEAAPAPAPEAAPAVRAPNATQPWSPADPPPRNVTPAAAPAPAAAPTARPPAAPTAAAPAPTGAAPVRDQAPAAEAAPARTPSLYTRLGGLSAVRSVVDTMLARVAADARINAFFRGVNMDSLRLNLIEQICDLTGGPCTYRGRPMAQAHRGLNLTNEHFDALVEDLVASLNAHGVPEREKTELVTALGRLRGEIVGK